MKKLVISACFALSACANVSDVDLSKSEQVCGQQCTSQYSACLSSFSLFPIRQQNNCADALRVCAKSCPAMAQKDNASAERKLADLSNIYKQGLISEPEYKAKRQEILKSM